MLTDYSNSNEAFVNALKDFLEYTDPDSIRSRMKNGNGLMVRRCFQKKEFEKRSFQRWAISELVKAILDNPEERIEDTTYKLTLRLLDFAQNTSDLYAQRVFLTAADFLENQVIDLFGEKGVCQTC